MKLILKFLILFYLRVLISALEKNVILQKIVLKWYYETKK